MTTSIATVAFGEARTRSDGSVTRTDVVLVDGEDIGVRFFCRAFAGRKVVRYWFVEDDPDSLRFENWIFARDRSYELSML